jgi:hypothetical protein
MFYYFQDKHKLLEGKLEFKEYNYKFNSYEMDLYSACIRNKKVEHPLWSTVCFLLVYCRTNLLKWGSDPSECYRKAWKREVWSWAFLPSNDFSWSSFSCYTWTSLPGLSSTPGCQRWVFTIEKGLVYSTEYYSDCPFVCIGSPPPPSHKRVCSPSTCIKGGHTRLRWRGVGGANSDDQPETLALCILCGFYQNP